MNVVSNLCAFNLVLKVTWDNYLLTLSNPIIVVVSETNDAPGWSKENLLQAWIENSESVCEEAGVEKPQDGSQDFLSEEDTPLQVGMTGSDDEMVLSDCGICCVACEQNVPVPCGHHFCRDCWKE